jgi:hypothetical protein
MKFNQLIVNNYLNNSSQEDQRKLLEALLLHFENTISNLRPPILDYPKDNALQYMSKDTYHLLQILPRNFFFTDEDIREQVMDLMPTLNQKDIKKIYLLLLNQRDTPEEEIFQSALNQPSKYPRPKHQTI